MANAERIVPGQESGAAFARRYIEHLSAILRDLDFEAVGRVIDLFRQARARGATIFFLGNGGSAATASHFANDFGVCASPDGHTPLRSVSLAGNMAFITCLANDFGYEQVFARQLRNLMRPGDVVVGISASGNSPNAVEALRYARDNGGIPVAIVGFDGGKMRCLADHVIHVQTGTGDYGPVEDSHLVLDHLMSLYLASVKD